MQQILKMYEMYNHLKQKRLLRSNYNTLKQQPNTTIAKYMSFHI